jgi:hypothetical protein
MRGNDKKKGKRLTKLCSDEVGHDIHDRYDAARQLVDQVQMLTEASVFNRGNQTSRFCSRFRRRFWRLSWTSRTEGGNDRESLK